MQSTNNGTEKSVHTAAVTTRAGGDVCRRGGESWFGSTTPQQEELIDRIAAEHRMMDNVRQSRIDEARFGPNYERI